MMGADRELFGRRKEGSLIAVEIELKPIYTGDDHFVLASVVDVSCRRRIQDAQPSANEGQREFERFVAELSFQFISIPGDEVIEAIGYGLSRIGHELNLDRCAFVRIGPDGASFDPVTWIAPGIPPVELSWLVGERFPWLKERMLAGDPVAFSTLADVPGGIDRTTFAATGTRSAVFIPLSVERRVTGAIGFSTVRAERIWSTETTQRLKVFGGVFSQILARQLRDEAMRAASLEVQRLKDRLEAETFTCERKSANGLDWPALLDRARRCGG